MECHYCGVITKLLAINYFDIISSFTLFVGEIAQRDIIDV